MEDNITEFLDESAVIVAQYHKDMFYENTKCEFEDLGIESPIEQLLYCALKTLQEINGISEDQPIEINNVMYILGLRIDPQEEIEKYRVDFLLTNYRIDHKSRLQISTSVIAECDSQIWHERNERERRYEKVRDRYLARKGYKIFHYTGTEIFEKPFEIAKELLEFVCNHGIDIAKQ